MSRGEPGGNSRPRSSHCLENPRRQRQTALFTDICQPRSQAGSWVSTGRRRPASGEGAAPEGQALLTHGGAGRQLPRDRVSVSTGGGRGLRTRPPGRLPSPPRPACPLPAPFSRQVTRRLSCPRPELHPGTFTVDESPLRSTGSSQTRGRLGRPSRCAHRSCRQAARTGVEVAYPGRGGPGAGLPGRGRVPNAWRVCV